MKKILIKRSSFYLFIYLFLLLASLFVVRPVNADHDAVCSVVDSEGCCFMMVTTHGDPPVTYGPVKVCNAPTVAPTTSSCLPGGALCGGSSSNCCGPNVCDWSNGQFKCIAPPPPGSSCPAGTTYTNSTCASYGVDCCPNGTSCQLSGNSATCVNPTSTPIPEVPPTVSYYAITKNGNAVTNGPPAGSGASYTVRELATNVLWSMGTFTNTVPPNTGYQINPNVDYTVTASSVNGYTISHQNGIQYNGVNWGGGIWSSGATYSPFRAQSGGDYDIGFRYTRILPTCSSLTKNARSGSGGTAATGTLSPGQSINLFANIINDDGDHSTSSWTSTCGNFTSTAWDYATFQAPVANTTCNISYSLNGANQPACTGSFIVETVSIIGRHVQANGTTLAPPPSWTNITIVGPSEGGSTSYTSSLNPWARADTLKGTYTITATPITGYNISYKCNNGNCATTGGADTNMDSVTYYAGNTLTKTLPNAGNYVDMYFRYVPAPPPPVPCNVTGAGDVNGDGYVTSADTTMISQHIVGLITLTAPQLLRAEVDGVAGLSIGDMVMVSGYANGTRTTFPVCAPTLPPGQTATVTPTPSPTSAPVCPATQIVSGNIYIDSGSNNCNSGFSNYTTATNVQFNRTNGTLTTASNASGAYSFTDVSACTEATKTLTLQLAPPYRVSAIKMSAAGLWTGHSSYNSPTFNQTTPRVINWCVTTTGPWYQVSSGDVRYPRVSNPVPASGLGSTGDVTNAGVYYSSDSIPNFNGRAVSAPNWNVPQEYNYNADFKNGLGTMSYSYYEAQARIKNIPITNLASSGENFGPAFPSGIYRRIGDLSFNSGITLQPGQRLIVLVSGSVFINTPVNVPSGVGSLFVVAAKNNIEIPASLGTTTLNDSTTIHMAGYYTAEKNINIRGASNCNSSIPDRRLNVSGALIANSVRPFTSDPTGGKIDNARTLCAAGNAANPTLAVYSRPEFLTHLTDFYKFTYKTVREVAP